MRLSTARHGLLGLAYALVAMLIVTRAPVILAAFTSGTSPATNTPAIEWSAPGASSTELGPELTPEPTIAAGKTARPSPRAAKDVHQRGASASVPLATPRPTPRPTPHPTRRTEDSGPSAGSSTTTGAPVPQSTPQLSPSASPTAPPTNGSQTHGSGSSGSHD